MQLNKNNITVFFILILFLTSNCTNAQKINGKIAYKKDNLTVWQNNKEAYNHKSHLFNLNKLFDKNN